MTLDKGSTQNAKIESVVRDRARDAIRRAAKAGVPVDRSFVEDSVLAVQQARHRCRITGRAFDIEYRTPGAGGTHYAPSPDRIVPERGYVRGNVRWILWCLNRGKGEMSAEDHLEVCRLVANHEATDANAEGEAIELSEDPGIPDAGPGTHRLEYTRRQVAAFKAHATMARKALEGLRGNARAAGLEKLARSEARLAAASAPPDA